MLVRCAATLVLALVVVCDATPTGMVTFGRRFGGRAFGAAIFSPFSHFSAASPRFSTANMGYEATPVGYTGFSHGRTIDTTIEAVEAVASESIERSAPTEHTGTEEAAVSFIDSSAIESSAASTGPVPSLAVTADSSAAEETKASSVSPELPSTSASASESASTGSSDLFPGQLSPVAPKTGDVFVPECDGVPFMALNSETGRCQFLMMRTECPEGELFILDHDTLKASCQPLPCPDTEVLFNGECRSRDDATLCPEGMVVLVNEYGDAFCDCAVKNVYWPAHDRCYEAFRQGPCRLGQYLTVGEDGVRCLENVCFLDGAALWNKTGQCYRLRDETDSPCALGRLDVGEDTLELECVETVPFGFLDDFPPVICLPGSRLDQGGNCKRVHQKFRSSVRASFSAGRKKCGEGFIAGLSGRCLKAAKGPKL